MKNIFRKKILLIIFLIIILFLITLCYYYININFNIGIPCIFYELTNLYCPGCGITRAIFCLLKGELINAMHNNLLLFIVGPFVIFEVINNIINRLINIKSKKIFPNILWNILLFITILFGICRNFDTFYFLQPIK